jgi:hypothetical protein
MYKYDYDYWVNHFTYSKNSKQIAGFNGTNFSATRLRNLVLKEIFEYISQDYKTFLKAYDWVAVKKRQEVRAAALNKDNPGIEMDI